MITTGLIKNINISSSNYINNKYLVELTIFQTPGDINKNNYTYLANCSATPGQYDPYKVGDKVYVGFLNNDLSLPIILGKIYQGINVEARSAIYNEVLSVTKKAELPRDTTIGGITYEQLLNLFNKQQKAYYMHNITAELESGNYIKFQLLSTAKTFIDLETNQISTGLVTYEFHRINMDSKISVEVYGSQNLSDMYSGKLMCDSSGEKLLVEYNDISESITLIQSDNIVEI